MSDATKHMANQILYKLNAKVGASVADADNPAKQAAPHALHAQPFQAPHATRLPKHILDHAINYIDKIKSAKRGIKPI